MTCQLCKSTFASALLLHLNPADYVQCDLDGASVDAISTTFVALLLHNALSRKSSLACIARQLGQGLQQSLHSSPIATVASLHPGRIIGNEDPTGCRTRPFWWQQLLGIDKRGMDYHWQPTPCYHGYRPYGCPADDRYKCYQCKFAVPCVVPETSQQCLLLFYRGTSH